VISLETLSLSKNKDSFLNEFSQLASNLNKDKNPFPMSKATCLHLLNTFPETEKELWLVKDGEKFVGRLCANTTKAKENCGYFGFFEVDLSHVDFENISKILFEAAFSWFKNKNVTEIYGPISLNVWMNYRYITTDSQPYSWEPSQPIQYISILNKMGLKLDQGYVSKFFLEGETSMKLSLERTKPHYDKIVAMGFKFRQINPSDPKEPSILYKLNLNAFKGNYLFEPISQSQYEATHIKAILGQDLKYSLFIISPDGRELGYLYTFIDQGLIVVKSILTQDDQQGAGFASALLHESFLRAKADGFVNGVGATLRKGNISEKFFNYMGPNSKEHEYYLFHKSLK
jgi:hypothetical protein